MAVCRLRALGRSERADSRVPPAPDRARDADAGGAGPPPGRRFERRRGGRAAVSGQSRSGNGIEPESAASKFDLRREAPLTNRIGKPASPFSIYPYGKVTKPRSRPHLRRALRPDSTHADPAARRAEIGRASCRERGGRYV